MGFSLILLHSPFLQVWSDKYGLLEMNIFLNLFLVWELVSM